MMNLIKADLYRIFKGKAIYIVFIVMIILLGFSCFAMMPSRVGIASAPDTTISGSVTEEYLDELMETDSLLTTREIMLKSEGFDLDQAVIGTNVNLYYFFIVILVVILVGDLSTSTAKNTLSSAVSRKKYYLAKLITVLGVCTLLVFINNYAAYFINLIMNGSKFSSGLGEITKTTFLQLPIIYGIISLLVCFGFCFRKTASFNGIAIPFMMIIQLILMGVASLFHLDVNQILNYEFQYMVANLASNPSISYIASSILLGVFYIVVFNFIGYSVFKKVEIK